MTANEYAENLRSWVSAGGGCAIRHDDAIAIADLLERQARRKPCPCLHTTPCHPRCTCTQPFSSRGCVRCCTYGSPDEQREMAEALASTGVLLARVVEAVRDALSVGQVVGASKGALRKVLAAHDASGEETK